MRFIALLFLACAVAGDTPYPTCDKKRVQTIVENFCEVDRSEVKDYSDCNDKQGYHFSLVGPGCAMSAPEKFGKVISIETFHDFVCDFDQQTNKPKKEAIELTCCDVTIQEMFKNQTDASGKLSTNTDCKNEVKGKKGGKNTDTDQ